MTTRGVTIGKFYPPHRGHGHLVEQARARCDALTVILCFKPDEDPPGSLRAAWLRELYRDVEVLLVEDVYPEEPGVWADNTIRVLGGPPDVAFTSEDYGDEWARRMGAAHVEIDRARRTFPCSGRAVRADPLAHWDCLAPCVRAYYAKRVCVVGAESSGTTTLARDLAAHYETEWVPEYGREYFERTEHSNRPWRSEELLYIAREQARREDEAARRANRLLVCDTDAFATGIWHERYLGHRSPVVESVRAMRACDLYVVTDIDIPFVQDGTRDGEHIRAWMHRRFVEALEERGTPFRIVSGTREARVRAAVGFIDEQVGA